MSTYNTYAIWGAGNLGARIATALLERKVSVIILTRPESVNNEQNKEFSSKGAEIRSYDVSSAAAVSGLQGVEVLISTIGAAGLSLQSKLIDAAHGAGVKLLVPAEFGDTTVGRTEPINLLKLAGHKQAVKLGLPTATVYTGPWMEYIPYFGFDLAGGKIAVNGSGDAKISTTSMADVAYFVAYVLTALPKDKLENATFTLQGDVITFNSLAASIKELASKPVEITHVPRSVFEEKVKADANDFFSALLLAWDQGKGLHPNPPTHDVIPNWQPKKVLEVLKPLIV